MEYVINRQYIYDKKKSLKIDLSYFKIVSDGKGLGQPACQEGWKKCNRDEK